MISVETWNWIVWPLFVAVASGVGGIVLSRYL